VIGDFWGLLSFFSALRAANFGGVSDASETLTAADLLHVEAEAGRFPIVRLAPSVGPEVRTGSHGPLYEPSASRHAVRRTRLPYYVPRELLEDLLSLAHMRCRLAGAQSVAGGIHNTWSMTVQILTSDLDVVVAALEALLAGDEGPLRAYLNHPPPLMRAGEVLAPHGRQLG
jgi:hypothetical protein